MILSQPSLVDPLCQKVEFSLTLVLRGPVGVMMVHITHRQAESQRSNDPAYHNSRSVTGSLKRLARPLHPNSHLQAFTVEL
ncbi:hypothetical protein E2C01_100348 [Portunus trituberculatus]|uniref:Uncharacterized protein n=1 Tax=Portunus trituberculatus TaxID=210409 RepID=A0A5B7KHR6_PORTR|nr:hypothetical protein [Portunus trituberculatus]